ncbi:MAG: 2-oxoacid:acceptor oxidoreductase family protein [Lentisphaeria bacterium]|nr:pyruvate ferredoxin oxidoreductase [Lentisphaerota bacterium]MBQ9771073.1 2-oxoacid:acceptor oxidoreductase family protein [Lentisphaeria bacterium]
MSKAITNVLFAGIGGQGIILASDLLSEMAFRCGFDVKKSEIHGMSQRGGSVSGDVRFGTKVYSPMIPAGEADYLVVLSEDQVEVCKNMINENTVILTPAILGDFDPGKSLNVAMLGALNAGLKLDKEIWFGLLKEHFKGELADVNIAAFERGEASVK